MRTITICVPVIVLFISSCISRFDPTPESTQGFVPVYATNVQQLKKVSSEMPRTSIRGGKMYTVGDLLYQVEQDSGIHVINYADPANPQKLAFIRSFLCKEVTVKNGFIYTNNMSDLVVIDVRDPRNAREISRVSKVFPHLDNQYPEKPDPFQQVYFECPDPSKGPVVGWKTQMISKPKCWR